MRKRHHELYRPQKDGHAAGAHREKEIKIHLRVRVKISEGPEQPVNRPRSAYYRPQGARLPGRGKQGGRGTAAQEIQKELARTHVRLESAAQHPEHQGVEEEMPEIRVDENIGESLPQPELADKIEGDQAEIEVQLETESELGQPAREDQDRQRLGDRRQLAQRGRA